MASEGRFKAFQLLSIEVNEIIASHIGEDRDFSNFGQICRETNQAVTTRRCGVWRDRFAKNWDLATEKPGKVLRYQYAIRRMQLRQKDFKDGYSAPERRCMAILIEIIKESYAGTPVPKTSSNIVQLEKFVRNSSVLNMYEACLKPYETTINPTWQALQLVFTHWMLDSSIYSPRFTSCGFPYSQKVVYRHPIRFPLFDDRDDSPNMKYMLHIANFFRFHTKTPEEGTLYRAFNALGDKEKPQAWKRAPFQGLGVKPLGRQWKGAYAHLPTPAATRRLRQLRILDKTRICDTIFQDIFNVDTDFHFIELDFSPRGNTAAWPEEFENCLQAIPSVEHCLDTEREAQDNIRKAARAKTCPPELHDPTRIPPEAIVVNLITPPPSPTAPLITDPREGYDYLPFSGCYENQYEEVHGLRGILHNIKDQCGIPGWGRINFMKFKMRIPDFDIPDAKADAVPYTPSFPPSSAMSTHFDFATEKAAVNVSVDEDCRCYEGLVLPGGHMIIGRWWTPIDPDEDLCLSGPFMMWCVDE